MQNKLEAPKKSFNRKMLIPVFAVLALSLVAAAVVWSYSFPGTATVNEAFTSATVSLDFSGVVGDTITQNINVHNAASVEIPVNVAWVETSNPNSVVYTTAFPATFTAQPGDNIIPVTFVYDTMSPTGTVDGTFTLTRGA